MAPDNWPELDSDGGLRVSMAPEQWPELDWGPWQSDSVNQAQQATAASRHLPTNLQPILH